MPLLLGLILFALFATSNAYAAEFSCVLTWNSNSKEIFRVNKWGKWRDDVDPPLGTCLTLKLKGQIQKGDFDKFFNIYKDNHPFLGDIKLKSAGRRCRRGDFNWSILKEVSYFRSRGGRPLSSLCTPRRRRDDPSLPPRQGRSTLCKRMRINLDWSASKVR